VHGEELLADAVERRDQRNDEGGVPNDEETVAAALGVASSREATIADGVCDSDRDQRGEE
jgi:hypothetical protein